MASQDRWTSDDGWPAADDDLDRAFGHDDGVARPSSHRVRRGALVLVGVVLAIALIAAALYYIVSGVQTGVGGIFPRPQQALRSFEVQSESLPGVTDVHDGVVAKTSFASYDVTASVGADHGVTGSAREDLVDELAAQLRSDSRSGVHVYAIVAFDGGIETGVSPDAGLDADRLALATTLDAVPGVDRTRCAWADDDSGPIDDDRSTQHVTLTVADATAVAGVTAAARTIVEKALPGATLEVIPAG